MKALLGAPVVYCVFAMWMFNNQQVFENKLVANKGQHLFADSDHNLTDIWTHMTPGMPYAILLSCLLLLAIFKSVVKLLEKYLKCDCFSKRFKIKVVQSLEPFYQALSQRQLQSFIKEEKAVRDELGFTRLMDDSFKQLTMTSTKRAIAENMKGSLKKEKDLDAYKCMEGVHNYNILSNQTWYDKFMYIPHNVDHVERVNRCVSMYKDEKMKLHSLAIVRLASDLAYMPNELALDAEFNPKYLEKIYNEKKSDMENSKSSNLLMGMTMH